MDVKRLPQAAKACLGLAFLLQGCSAMHTMKGVPASYMPAEFHPETREGKSTIDLSRLQRSRPDQYRIEAGDVLTVYVPGLLGLADTSPERPSGDSPPINLPTNPTDRPSLGFPVTVRDDHSIQLPQLPAIDVYELTVREVEDRIRQNCLSQGVLAANTKPRIVVDIHRKRTVRILVYREDTNSASSLSVMAGTINLGQTGKGTSRAVELQAYENDVAHALAQLGVEGLPGLDARNVIYVIRSRNGNGGTARRAVQTTPTGYVIRGQSPDRWGGGASSQSTSGQGPNQYLTTSQLNLSGGDVSRGYAGPPLNSGVPPGHSLAGGHSAMGAGHSAAQNYSPTTSLRGHSFGAASQPATSNSQYASGQPDPYGGAYRQGGGPQPAPQLSNPYQSVQYSPQPNYAPQQNYTPAPGMGAAPNVQPHSVMMEPTAAPYHHQQQQQQPLEQVWSQSLQQFDPTVDGDHVIKIPVRLAPGETLDITEEDITLYDGDIVFIENRETDVYYIGGLLGGGQYTLPRDKDLHILEALSLAQGQNSRQAGSQGLQSSGGVSALNRDVVPSASRVLIIRQVNCQQVHLEVNLYKALKYPQENIVIQPGDLLVLQYTRCEAFGAFIQRNIFEGALLGIAAGSFQSGGQ